MFCGDCAMVVVCSPTVYSFCSYCVVQVVTVCRTVYVVYCWLLADGSETKAITDKTKSITEITIRILKASQEKVRILLTLCSFTTRTLNYGKALLFALWNIENSRMPSI